MKKYIILLILILLLSGCASKPVFNNVEALPDNGQQKDTTYELTSLNIELPKGWKLDTTDEMQFNFVDDKGDKKGWVIADKFNDNNTFTEWKPNHSEITGDENIDIPLGKCRLFTLDADNSTAASGVTGTHNDYYAIIPMNSSIRYIFEFSQNDKNSQTKEQFIEILKNIKIKGE
jgi:uncharacterized protein YceK